MLSDIRKWYKFIIPCQLWNICIHADFLLRVLVSRRVFPSVCDTSTSHLNSHLKLYIFLKRCVDFFSLFHFFLTLYCLIELHNFITLNVHLYFTFPHSPHVLHQQVLFALPLRLFLNLSSSTAKDDFCQVLLLHFPF